MCSHLLGFRLATAVLITYHTICFSTTILFSHCRMENLGQLFIPFKFNQQLRSERHKIAGNEGFLSLQVEIRLANY